MLFSFFFPYLNWTHVTLRTENIRKENFEFNAMARPANSKVGTTSWQE